MSPLDTFTRAEFSEVVAEVLAGTFSRTELGDSWIDTYDINILRVRVSGFQEPKRMGQVEVEVLAVRFDRTATSIWLKQAQGLDGLREALLALQQVLLGLAAAFLSLCKDPEALPVGSTGPRRPSETLGFDFDAMISQLLE